MADEVRRKFFILLLILVVTLVSAYYYLGSTELFQDHTLSLNSYGTEQRMTSDSPHSVDLNDQNSSSKGIVSHSSSLLFDLDLTLPNPHILKDRVTLHTISWIRNLRDTMSHYQHKQVNIILANWNYKDLLLNWIITATVVAKMDLETILVLSMDENLHNLLSKKGIISLCMPPQEWMKIYHLGRKKNFLSSLFMSRMAVQRVLNYWGFDVANYDSDAMVVKNLQPVLDSHAHSDIVGSKGTFPRVLSKKWKGSTLCYGVQLIRSTNRTEELWKVISKLNKRLLDDQARLNHGLYNLDVKWKSEAHVQQGKCNNNLSVSLLPHSIICRMDECDDSKKDSYYVWHNGGINKEKRTKLNVIKNGSMWNLYPNWEEKCTTDTGYEWLKCIQQKVVHKHRKKRTLS